MTGGSRCGEVITRFASRGVTPDLTELTRASNFPASRCHWDADQNVGDEQEDRQLAGELRL